MSNIQPRLEPPDPKYLAMAADELLEFVMRLTEDIAGRLVELGRAMYAMKHRGDDMTLVYRRWRGMMYLLIRVGEGTVIPQVFERFGNYERLWRAVSSLDTIDQRRLAIENQRVPLLTFDPKTGEATHRLVDPLELGDKEIKMVFAKDHIRTEAEQQVFLDRERRERRRPDVEEIGKAKVDRVTKRVRVGNHVFTFDEWRRINRLLGDD